MVVASKSAASEVSARITGQHGKVGTPRAVKPCPFPRNMSRTSRLARKCENASKNRPSRQHCCALRNPLLTSRAWCVAVSSARTAQSSVCSQTSATTTSLNGLRPALTCLEKIEQPERLVTHPKQDDRPCKLSARSSANAAVGGPSHSEW